MDCLLCGRNGVSKRRPMRAISGSSAMEVIAVADRPLYAAVGEALVDLNRGRRSHVRSLAGGEDGTR